MPTQPSAGAVTIYRNLHCHTMDPTNPSRVTAFAVRNAKFVGVGTDDEMIRDFPGSPQVNLQGAYVVPGLIDAHAHLVDFGLTRVPGYQVDLSGAGSIEGVRIALQHWA